MKTYATSSKANRQTQHAVQRGASVSENAKAITPPAYGIEFVDRGMSSRSKQEAAFDFPDKDKDKEEVGISWKEPTYNRNSASLPASLGGRAKKQAVTWGTADYSSSTSNGSSTCVEKPFTVTYTKVTKNDLRKLKVKSIGGGATIKVNTGGSRNAITEPPISEAEATDAVTDMKGYYARGTRGDWHTEAASKSHELHHYLEWKETCNHYWPTCRTAIERLSVPKSQVDADAAIEGQAQALVDGFKAKSWDYWFTLGDGAGDRPYAAGQLTLNTAIKSVQSLAKRKHWTVPAGVDTPSAADPTYQPWLAYNP